MSSHNNAILYSPLEPDEIRLLVLLPGSRSESIQCRLATVKLQSQEEVPVYHTLSYMWGPPLPTTLIYVNDSPFEVRDNLFQALKQLRQEYLPRCLWVDAVCINQKDNSERGHQVAIMSSVFRAATKVLVWLGEANENSDMAFEALASVHGHLGLLRSMAKSWIMAGVDGSRYPLSQVEVALLSICNRPYWRRLWIIQEILSASSVGVLCGPKVLGWGEFWTGLQCVANINISSPLNAAAACVSTAAYHIAHKSSRQCQSYTMEELFDLCSTCGSQCEDIRDKIYELLSLCKDLQIVPDYTKSALDLYLDVIQAYYSGSHALLREPIPFQYSVFDRPCTFIETTKSLLGEPFWNSEQGKYLMAPISSPLFLSQKCKETSIDINMYKVTRIRQIGPEISTETPHWESHSYFNYPPNASLTIERNLLRGLSQIQSHTKAVHSLAAFQGVYFLQNHENLNFVQDKSITDWGALDSDAKYRMFYNNDMVCGISSVSTEIGDVLCFAGCFGWFVIRFVGDGESFFLLGRALVSYYSGIEQKVQKNDIKMVVDMKMLLLLAR